MSDRLLVATRKGLFTLERRRSGWTAEPPAFTGIPVTNALRASDGVVYAALKHGHFGPKLHRSDDDGSTWRELSAPAFPPDAQGAPSLFQIWTLESGGRHHLDRLWIGAIPAGLFRSDDRGENWQLVSSLWDVPERARWFGGGYDAAEFTACCPTRAIRTALFSRSRAAGYGTAATTAPIGRCVGKDLLPPICRRNRQTTAQFKIPIASSGVSASPTSCGCSTTTAYSDRPMPARTGRNLRRR